MIMNDSDPPKPKRRWYRFSLRTLLLFLLVAGIGFGWVCSTPLIEIGWCALTAIVLWLWCKTPASRYRKHALIGYVVLVAVYALVVVYIRLFR